MYVDIVILNVFNLNKRFFFFDYILSSLSWAVSGLYFGNKDQKLPEINF